jgi:hypothetical protein
MNNVITVITPTGDRPDALDRLSFYLARQTIFPNYWVVSDDGKEAYKPIQPTMLHTIYNKRPSADNKAKSFTGNLLNCIALIPEETTHVIIMEDDDWYHPKYIDITMRRFNGTHYRLIGQNKTIYYQVDKCAWRQNGNKDRASLCETSLTMDLIPSLKKMCDLKRQSAFVDQRIWAYAKKAKIPHFLFADKRYVIGIKGMPGRRGIGIGHRSTSYRKDPYYEYLAKLIGQEDANWYKRLLESKRKNSV